MPQTANLLINGNLAEAPGMGVPVHIICASHSAAHHVASMAGPLVALCEDSDSLASLTTLPAPNYGLLEM